MTVDRQVVVGQTVSLEIEITDIGGTPVDADAVPQVEIIDSRGTVQRALSLTNVYRIAVGKYRLNYTVPVGSHTGVWSDHWIAYVGGFETEATLYFVVLSVGASIAAGGDEIGDAPQVLYSQAEIIGINILLAQLKARLNNNIQSETTDAYGNISYVDCAVFTNEELVWFLRCALSEFNEYPHFTDFTFDSQTIYERYAYVIIEGAFILATAAKMLIEAGREFTISDNGITMNPPNLSAALNNELSNFITPHRELVKMIKWSIKPHPIGFGSFRVLAVSPALLRLRHLRQRRII